MSLVILQYRISIEPKPLHRFGDALIADGERLGGEDDTLLTTAELCLWLRRSKQWAEIGRSKGYGPPFVKIGHAVRYRKADVLQWLRQNTVTSTAAYSNAVGGPGRGRRKNHET